MSVMSTTHASICGNSEMPEITADEMERVTLRMTAEMVAELELHVDNGAYPNRSEAVRDAVREKFGLVKRTSI